MRRPAQALCLISESDGDNRVEADIPDELLDSEEEEEEEQAFSIGDQVVAPVDTQDEPLIPADIIEDDDVSLENVDLGAPDVSLVPVTDNIEVPTVRILHPENVPAIVDVKKKVPRGRRKNKQS